MKLYSYWRSSAAYRVRIALNLKRLDYQLESIHLLSDGGHQYSGSYQQVNPQQRVPALQLADGQVLTQSLAIIEYLDETYAEPALLPQHILARAQVRALAQLIACDIHPVNNLRVIRYLKIEFGQTQEAADDWYRHWLAQGLRAYQAMLDRERDSANCASGVCSLGDTPSLADICLIPQLYNARRFALDLSPYPTLLVIDQHCRALPAFQQAHPDRQPDAESGV